MSTIVYESSIEVKRQTFTYPDGGIYQASPTSASSFSEAASTSASTAGDLVALGGPPAFGGGGRPEVGFGVGALSISRLFCSPSAK
jgi:hypothetical protein